MSVDVLPQGFVSLLLFLAGRLDRMGGTYNEDGRRQADERPGKEAEQDDENDDGGDVVGGDQTEGDDAREEDARRDDVQGADLVGDEVGDCKGTRQ